MRLFLFCLLASYVVYFDISPAEVTASGAHFCTPDYCGDVSDPNVDNSIVPLCSTELGSGELDPSQKYSLNKGVLAWNDWSHAGDHCDAATEGSLFCCPTWDLVGTFDYTGSDCTFIRVGWADVPGVKEEGDSDLAEFYHENFTWGLVIEKATRVKEVQVRKTAGASFEFCLENTQPTLEKVGLQ
ncbi:uncharacterized protein MELLADRAFT_108700 [Melampsora larici-populina 98AG31]|uniref:Secreted protein n=1 Tax=Melampsora larici-populina (strain 98AG31 / pathotype 3-4-7) TaxID=747676 RepID=F4RTY6_MELLP|nr:uncharacterized protein MELLADRAFT_108700 [Melampsora larici-populina 98AG31]EGG04087.1 hypothetical protein MELLADRAFT_108700 [Melampsora larici-populina 98AG31]